MSRGNVSLGVVNLSGIVHLQAASPPLVAVDAALREVSGADHVLVDMHAEMTSEKVALGWYLDGKVTAVVGTHTHVPTADARVLPGGTAYITDVGMTGARGGVIGMKKEQSIAVMRTHMPMRYEPSDEDPWLNAVLIRAGAGTARGVHRASPAAAALSAAASANPWSGAPTRVATPIAVPTCAAVLSSPATRPVPRLPHAEGGRGDRRGAEPEPGEDRPGEQRERRERGARGDEREAERDRQLRRPATSEPRTTRRSAAAGAARPAAGDRWRSCCRCSVASTAPPDVVAVRTAAVETAPTTAGRGGRRATSTSGSVAATASHQWCSDSA